MEHEIETILLEAERVESFLDYEIVEDDPEGYRFGQGWALGLTRATEILTGSEALEYEEIEAFAAQQIVKGRGEVSNATYPKTIALAVFTASKSLKYVTNLHCQTAEEFRSLLLSGIASHVLDGETIIIEEVRE